MFLQDQRTKAFLTTILIGAGFLLFFSPAALSRPSDEKPGFEFSYGGVFNARIVPYSGAVNQPGFKSVLSLRYSPQDPQSGRQIKGSAASREVPQDLKRPPKNYRRATLELGGVLMYSQIRYWVNYAAYVEDWQYHLSLKDQVKRFFTFQALRFDSNAFSVNWTHGLAGVLYYQFARTNNLSSLESFLYTLGGSLWWEYVVEWREVISINDNIMTAIGGYAAGEPWYQLAKYFNNKKGPYNQLLGFVDPVLKINRWLDRNNSGSWRPDPEPGWHDFRVFVGDRNMPTAKSSKPVSNLFFGFRTWIINIPEYGRPEKSSRTIRDTLASEMFLDFTLRQGGIEEANFATRLTSFGYFNQNIDASGRGHAYYVGLGSAFSFFKKRSVSVYDSDVIVPKPGTDLHLEEPRNFKDKIAAVHIAGPIFDYAAFTPKTRLRLILDAYLDFGLVNAFALNKYSAANDIHGIKTTLMYYGYYYGIGTSISSGLTFDIRSLELDGLIRYQTYGSIDGRDRFQADVTDNFHVKDSRLSYSLAAAFQIPKTSVLIRGQYEGIDRRGTIKTVKHKNIEERISLSLIFRI